MEASARKRARDNRLQSRSEDAFDTVKVRGQLYTAIRNDENIIKILDAAKYAGQTTFRDIIISTNKSEGTALHCAIRARNIHTVITLLNVTKNFNYDDTILTELFLSRDELGKTPLHAAAKVGDVNIVKILLDFANNVKKYSQHDSKVQWVYYSTDVTHKLLLSSDDYGGTALHDAAKVGNVHVANTLLLAANNISRDTVEKLLVSTNISGDTALHSAATVGDINVVSTLLLAADYLGRYMLEELLVSTNKSNKTALHDVAERLYNCIIAQKDHTCNGRYTRTLEKLLLVAGYIDVLTVLLKSSGNATVFYINCGNDINSFINFLKNTKYVKNYTLKHLLSLPSVFEDSILCEAPYTYASLAQAVSLDEEETIKWLSCTQKYTRSTRSKRSTHEELGNVIDQDSSDNAANTVSKNVDTKSSSWFQWLNDLLQLPSIFQGAEATVIENTIAHLEEEHEYFNQANYIPSSSNVDRALESVDYNTNYTAANSSTRPPIGNGINNSVQNIVLSINNNVMLLGALLKMLGINISLGNYGNNYTAPQEEHEMKLKALALDILPALHVRNSLLKDSLRDEDLFEDDVLEDGALDLLFTNSSSSQLQGDIQENEPE